MKIDASSVIFYEETELIKPKSKILYGIDTKKKLVLKDIVIRDPADDALFTNSPNIVFKNISVIKEECACNQYVFSTIEDFKSNFEICTQDCSESIPCNKIASSDPKCQMNR